MKRLFGITLSCIIGISVHAQPASLAKLAKQFTQSLNKEQQLKLLYPFESEERFNFHFVPKERKGISINELNDKQKNAALRLLAACLSKKGLEKTVAIMQLEKILKVIEKRAEDDRYRDTGKYYIIIFGEPSDNGIWGWRFEGHHVSYSFSANKNVLVSGTPGFLGSNPGIVKEGPEKGKQLLKDEANLAFDLLHSFSKDALSKVVIATPVPNDILSFVQRKPVIENSQGILYSDMNGVQKEKLRALINVYIHRYTRLFAESMLKEIQRAGMNNLRFVWIGPTDAAPGKAHYYRIQGPTLLIEFDNSQNNANHVHTVIRDLKNDFGGDILAEHYKKEH